MTAERLRNIAVWYCQRYLVSSAKLAGYLEKRLWREVPDPSTRTALASEIPIIIANLSEIGLVNDREAASARLRSALRSGYASDAAVTVAAHGAIVDHDTVRDALEVALREALPEIKTEDADAAELALQQASSALKRARRGPWRGGVQDDTTRRRDAGWLQRRGFRLDTIKAALDIDPEID